MKFHEATIKEARRQKNEAFDRVLILFCIHVSKTETQTFKFDMVNNSFLLNKLFDFTDTTSGNIDDIVGKTMRVCVDGKCAIGHPTEDRFVVLNINKELKMEDLNKI